ELLQNIGETTHLYMQLQIRERPLLTGLAFPDKGGLVFSPGGQMTVDTVVRYIEPSPDKPLCKRLIPLKHARPWLKPIKGMRLLLPESGRIRGCLGVHLLVLFKAFDNSVCGKIRRRGEDTVFR